MITGGYNIVDFGGAEFQVNTPVEITDEVIKKFTDTSKPVLVGNFHIISDEGNLKLTVVASFAQIAFSEGAQLVVNMGSIIAIVNINAKTALFQVYD